MKIYLVGGAVRDSFLGKANKDKDFIVLNSSHEEMTSKGFISVGEHFEVYLHPKTKQEYSLAKNNNLEDELFRRDLTVNSIAQDTETKEFIDPFNGLSDIRKKILRHTSHHFTDDPIRILRLARFMLELNGFRVDEDTLNLINKLSTQKNLFQSIPGERFQIELKKILTVMKPADFFRILSKWKILELFFFDLNEKAIIDFARVSKISLSPSTRYACLLKDTNYDLVENSLSFDSRTLKVTHILREYSEYIDRVFERTSSEILDLLISLNALREGNMFDEVLGYYHPELKQRVFLNALRVDIKSCSYTDLTKKFKGKELGEKIQMNRIQRIESFRGAWDN